MSLLELNSLTAGYGQTPVLFDVDMVINKGDMVGLLGRNGVGKTTLLRSIIGLNKLTKGNLSFNNKDITKAPTYKRSRYGIAYIPQGREIIPYLSVLDNLKLGFSASGKSSKRIPSEIFEFFPIIGFYRCHNNHYCLKNPQGNQNTQCHHRQCEV